MKIFKHLFFAAIEIILHFDMEFLIKKVVVRDSKYFKLTKTVYNLEYL